MVRITRQLAEPYDLIGLIVLKNSKNPHSPFSAKTRCIGKAGPARTERAVSMEIGKMSPEEQEDATAELRRLLTFLNVDD
jgi:hypothetical protein